jgi:alpha-1,6-mannosyltransferase
MNNRDSYTWVALMLSLVLYMVLGYLTPRENFPLLISCYSLLFVMYVVVYYNANISLKWLLVIALLFRASLLFSYPALSDDFYRFAWDGRLLAQGINPFLYLPSEVLQMHLPGLDNTLFSALNSPNYYSIYPPASQFIFGISALIFPDDLVGQVIIMRLFILLMEAGTLYLIYRLLKQFHLKEKLLLLYAFNPLVIMELSGNLHLEAGMICFALLAIWCMVKRKPVLASIALSIAIAFKLWPLLFVPFFLKGKDYKWMGKFTTGLSASLVLMILPFWFPDLFSNFGSSVNLYFRHFEFNGSIYYLVRYIGFQVKGYDIIATAGPLLQLISLLSMAIVFWRYNSDRQSGIFKALLFILTIYLLFATTVHPWYITPLIALSVFSGLRYPVIWSALVPLTYITYSHLPYWENLWLVGFEYVVVAAFILYQHTTSDMESPEPA